MDVVLPVLEGLAVVWLAAGSGWLWSRAKKYLDNQKRLEQRVEQIEKQVEQLQQAVLVALQKLESHDTAIDDTLVHAIDDVRNMVYVERRDRTADVERVQAETAERFGGLPAKVVDLEAAIGHYYQGAIFDRSPIAERMRQAAKDYEKGPVDPHGSDAPVGR